MGDLDDLLPSLAADGRTPDQVSDAELLSAAGVVLSRLDLPPADTVGAALDAIAEHLLSAG